MKTNLDISILPDFLNRFFSDTSERLVGPKRDIDSGYFAITRFFGNEVINPSTITIIHKNDIYSFSNPTIASFSAEREIQMKAEGRLYEGPLVTRVVDVDFSKSTITVQPCRYADQAGTCFSLDGPDERFVKDGGTLREYYKRTSRSSAFTDIPFPLCFGVCGFLLVQNESEPPLLLLVYRSGKLASLENSIGPSMAGAIDYHLEDTTLLQMLTRSADQEIAEELLLKESEYQLTPLAFAREIFRGERPQLFCLITTRLTSHELSQRLEAAKTDSREFTEFEFVPLVDGKLPEAKLATLNYEARMSYWLTQEYLLNR